MVTTVVMLSLALLAALCIRFAMAFVSIGRDLDRDADALVRRSREIVSDYVRQQRERRLAA